MTELGAIRAATIDDADQLWPLVRDFANSFDPEHEAFAKSLPTLLGRDDTLLIVAEVGGAVAGYLLASVHLTLLANGPVAWIEEVAVDSEYRRSGMGTRLMATAEAWAREQDVAYVSLASRRAADFYLALGYEDSAVFFKRGLKPVR
jgi:GNAT superfamily N-acetyltransferase